VGDYVVVLTLDSGEEVYLDDNDNEIKREVVPTVDHTQSALGDFNPAAAPPEETETLASAEAEDTIEAPVGLGQAANLKEAVLCYTEAGFDPVTTVDQVEAVQEHFTVLKGKPDIRKRVIRILRMTGTISEDTEQEMLGA
jgi:hypothetical protein